MGWNVLFSLCLSLLLYVCAQDNKTPKGKKPHPCDRPCDPSQPMECYFTFYIEWYYTMAKPACGDCPFVMEDCYKPQCIAANGFPRPIISINRMSPGPAIKVCEGDRIIATVINRLDSGESTTIHWHGMNQRGTPYMDGAHLITQCPIAPMNEFTYDFVVDVAGTYFYHSHTGYQRGDGMHGPLVVHSFQSLDPNWEHYDHNCDTPSGECEHILMVSDYLNQTTIDRYMNWFFQEVDLTLPIAALINGQSDTSEYTDPDSPSIIHKTPLHVFNVEKGKRYRFRVINAFAYKCPFKISIDGHSVMLVSADGRNIKPVIADTFILSPGERFDFILTAGQPVDNYWVKAFGFIDCEPLTVNVQSILRYKGAADQYPAKTERQTDRGGKMVNPMPFRNKHVYKASHGPENDIHVYELNATGFTDLSDQEPSSVFFLGMDFRLNDPSRYHVEFGTESDQMSMQKSSVSLVVNNISFRLPSVPLLTQPEDFDQSELCNANTINIEKCLKETCFCTHCIKVTKNEVVEMVLVDEGKFADVGHPIHLHGYHFYVLGSGSYGKSVNTSQVYEDYYAGNLPRKLVNPPLKDTVMVPDGGYVIIHFEAHNLGVWNMHCHRSIHNQLGHGLLIQVGDHEEHPLPPKGFPRCGNWHPAVHPDSNYDTSPALCPDRNSGDTSNDSMSLMITISIIMILLIK